VARIPRIAAIAFLIGSMLHASAGLCFCGLGPAPGSSAAAHGCCHRQDAAAKVGAGAGCCHIEQAQREATAADSTAPRAPVPVFTLHVPASAAPVPHVTGAEAVFSPSPPGRVLRL
jgi:TctA family transporter